MTLKVIGAGFGRTGTASLKMALERLGFGPCDHMGEVFAHPERARSWLEAFDARQRGEAFDWGPLHDGYGSTADWPGAFFWRDFAAAYPEAKVILSLRDPERWYESAHRTIYRIRHDEDAARRMGEMIGSQDDLAWMPRLVDRVVFEGTFHNRFDDRAYAIDIFNAHNAAVIEAVAPERLLVFEARDGWEPICQFLGVPVPEDESFPHVNEAAMFEARIRGEIDDDAFVRQLTGRP